MTPFRTLALVAAAAGLSIAVPASAQPRVAASAPAASSTASNVRTVTITFSEAVAPAQSGLEILMTGMPGMAGHHPAMKMPGVRVAAGADGRTLVATLPKPLPAGTYDVNWHAAGADAQRAAGTVSFTVR